MTDENTNLEQAVEKSESQETPPENNLEPQDEAEQGEADNTE